MAAVHYRPFIDFVKTGKKKQHGHLSMEDNSVWSYWTLIASVDRDTKTITYLDKKFSRTTTVHQNAVRMGFDHTLKGEGWTLVSASRL